MGFHEGSTGRATLVLAGEHTATVNITDSGTAQARLSILWAAGMLTFTTRDQVTALAAALVESVGVRALVPTRVPRRVVEFFVPRFGVSTTAATLGETPKVRVIPNSEDLTGRGGWAHQVRWIDVDTGPLTLRVLDLAAFTTLTGQVRHAADLASVGLRPAQVVPRVPATEPDHAQPR